MKAAKRKLFHVRWCVSLNDLWLARLQPDASLLEIKKEHKGQSSLEVSVFFVNIAQWSKATPGGGQMWPDVFIRKRCGERFNTTKSNVRTSSPERSGHAQRATQHMDGCASDSCARVIRRGVVRVFERAHAHPLLYFVTDDAAEKRRRGNIPQCHAARPMGRTRADARNSRADAADSCSPHATERVNCPRLHSIFFLKFPRHLKKIYNRFPVRDVKVKALHRDDKLQIMKKA